MIEPIEIDSDQLRPNFKVRPVRVKHGLEHNPLFQLDALLGAANRLPPALIECNAGDVPIRCPEQLAGAIQLLANDRGLAERNGRAGQARVRKYFTWASISDRYIEAYSQASEIIAERVFDAT